MTAVNDARNDFAATATWERLSQRASLLTRTRRFFDGQGFVEVETPLLSHDTVVDRHLEPISVDWPLGPSGSRQMWLQTSPEFGMKRLLASGARAIYQIARAFRGGEQGPLHNGEFTILEWYRRGDSYAEGRQLLDDYAQQILQRGAAQQFSYRDAFLQQLGIDPFDADVEALREVAVHRGLDVTAWQQVEERDAWLDMLRAQLVEPTLGRAAPAIVFDWPASQSALAKVRDDDPPVAERFELYVDGLEIANGYCELTDADELLQRNRHVNRMRASEGKSPLPETSRMLHAMRHGLPDCSGVALGFDRLAMVALGASSISQVIAFPMARA